MVDSARRSMSRYGGLPFLSRRSARKAPNRRSCRSARLPGHPGGHGGQRARCGRPATTSGPWGCLGRRPSRIPQPLPRMRRACHQQHAEEWWGDTESGRPTPGSPDLGGLGHHAGAEQVVRRRSSGSGLGGEPERRERHCRCEEHHGDGRDFSLDRTLTSIPSASPTCRAMFAGRPTPFPPRYGCPERRASATMASRCGLNSLHRVTLRVQSVKIFKIGGLLGCLLRTLRADLLRPSPQVACIRGQPGA